MRSIFNSFHFAITIWNILRCVDIYYQFDENPLLDLYELRGFTLAFNDIVNKFTCYCFKFVQFPVGAFLFKLHEKWVLRFCNRSKISPNNVSTYSHRITVTDEKCKIWNSNTSERCPAGKCFEADLLSIVRL